MTLAADPFDYRGALFGDMLQYIRTRGHLSEPRGRAIIGRWLKLSGDDAGALWTTIRDVQTKDLRDPVSYIESILSVPRSREVERLALVAKVIKLGVNPQYVSRTDLSAMVNHGLLTQAEAERSPNW